MAQVEADHDNLLAVQTATTSTLDCQKAQLQLMARHIDNRGRRRNMRIRGLPEGDESPEQLKGLLTSTFNGLLHRPRDTIIEFMRAHMALRPKGHS
ncbi:Hypothetical predicted protein [Pelobates cultripes]|uniref:Uncharacterized protein n=1 Tax=Pelobates cultripes TaxID=61616 RepID=A0AAD1R808_PELCU|nr:Hypothetical predicted protein [Pelobates cultripes]